MTTDGLNVDVVDRALTEKNLEAAQAVADACYTTSRKAARYCFRKVFFGEHQGLRTSGLTFEDLIGIGVLQQIEFLKMRRNRYSVFPEGLLFVVARNGIFQELRNRKILGKNRVVQMVSLQELHQHLTIAQAMSAQALLARIRLTAEQKRIVDLKLDGATVAEIAEELELSNNKVNEKLRGIRELLESAGLRKS